MITKLYIKNLDERFDDRLTGLNPTTKIKCNKCGWSGLPKNCKHEDATESWENPHLILCLCLQCGGEMSF